MKGSHMACSSPGWLSSAVLGCCSVCVPRWYDVCLGARWRVDRSVNISEPRREVEASSASVRTRVLRRARRRCFRPGECGTFLGAVRLIVQLLLPEEHSRRRLRHLATLPPLSSQVLYPQCRYHAGCCQDASFEMPPRYRDRSSGHLRFCRRRPQPDSVEP